MFEETLIGARKARLVCHGGFGAVAVSPPVPRALHACARGPMQPVGASPGLPRGAETAQDVQKGTLGLPGPKKGPRAS